MYEDEYVLEERVDRLETLLGRFIVNTDTALTRLEREMRAFKNEKTRDWVLNALTAENIGVGVHYLPVHLHPYYRKTFGWKQAVFPNAEWIGERTISLPLSAPLSELILMM